MLRVLLCLALVNARGGTEKHAVVCRHDKLALGYMSYGSEPPGAQGSVNYWCQMDKALSGYTYRVKWLVGSCPIKSSDEVTIELPKEQYVKFDLQDTFNVSGQVTCKFIIEHPKGFWSNCNLITDLRVERRSEESTTLPPPGTAGGATQTHASTDITRPPQLVQAVSSPPAIPPPQQHERHEQVPANEQSVRDSSSNCKWPCVATIVGLAATVVVNAVTFYLCFLRNGGARGKDRSAAEARPGAPSHTEPQTSVPPSAEAAVPMYAEVVFSESAGAGARARPPPTELPAYAVIVGVQMYR